MAEKDERLESLKAGVETAQRAISDLDDDVRNANPDVARFAEEVLAFAAIALERSDSPLMSAATYSAIQAATQQIVNSPPTTVSNEAHADALLQAILRLPAERDRAMEQTARGAAATFHRSLAQRLATLRTELGGAKGEIVELSTKVDTLGSGFDAKLIELEQTITNQRTAFDQVLSQHSASFSEAQGERVTEFQEQLEDFKRQLSEATESAREEVEEHVAEIRRMEEESARQVGAIGLTGTAVRYGQEAQEQKKLADVFRFVTIGLAFGAVLMALYATVKGDQAASALIAKLAVSGTLGAIATYTAQQSGKHRRREEAARKLQLDLTAFSPFVEPLPDEQRDALRILVAGKTFAGETIAAVGEEHGGPTLLSLLLRRGRRGEEAEEE